MTKKRIKTFSLILALSVVISGSAGILLVKNSDDISASDSINNTKNSIISDIENSDTDISDLPVLLSNKVNIETSNEEINFETEKDEIWHKMLNTIDYFNSVSGKFVYADSPNDGRCVEYQSDLDKSKAYTSISEVSISDISALMNGNLSECSDKKTFDIDVFTDGNSLITLNKLDGTAAREENAVFTRENSEPIDDADRVTVEEDGMPGYYYRCDITNTYLASVSLFPQEMAFGFLTDFELWDVDGVEEYAGRECYVISGKTADDYKNKIGIESFTFYVDCKTGILLKYIGYDDAQNVYNLLITDNIKFGDEAAKINNPDVASYEFIG